MGAGASIDLGALPDVLNEHQCREISGKNFDDSLFNSVVNSDGTITKQKFNEVLSRRTDCFLTHDWGKELGMDNHARVGIMNRALQQRGLTTWFDEEQMQGIDNAQCVVVFITKRYTEKVAGDNAEDNCQLEFNYAALRKTATRMISVVMEERMRNTRTWGGEVAMVLGGRLYVDLCGDLNDKEYLNKKADELHDTIMGVIGLKVKDFNLIQQQQQPVIENVSSGKAQTTTTTDNTNNKSLVNLTVTDVASLLQSLELDVYKDEFIKNKIDGTCLMECSSVDEVKEMGITMTVKAKLFYNKILNFKTNGVPEDCLSDNKEKLKKLKLDEERAVQEKIAAEEKAKKEKAIAEEKAKAEKAVAEEKAKAEKTAAEEKAKKEKAAAEEKAKAERNATTQLTLPLVVKVSCHQHDLKKVVPMKNSGWACDGRKLTSGCKSNLTDFYKSNGYERWNCSSCDFDLCEKCVQAYPSTGSTSTANTSTTTVGEWKEAKSPEGKTYYWNTVTRESRWDNPLLKQEETKRLSTTNPRCTFNHNMSYILSNSSNSAYTSWICDLCRKHSKDNIGTVWAYGRYHCKTDQSDLCITCYDNNNGNQLPVESNGKHSMPLSLNCLGGGNDEYKTGWHCDKCSKTTARNEKGINIRYCCRTCKSDLCSPSCH